MERPLTTKHNKEEIHTRKRIKAEMATLRIFAAFERKRLKNGRRGGTTPHIYK
jgi:hypothetical protein